MNGKYDLDASTNKLIHDSADYALTRYDERGNIIWSTPIPGVNGISENFQRRLQLAEVTSRGIFLFGDIENENFDLDPSPTSKVTPAGAFVCKFDLDGNFLWSKSPAETNNHGILIRDLKSNENGDIHLYILTGPSRFVDTIDIDNTAGEALIYTDTSQASIVTYDSELNFKYWFWFRLHTNGAEIPQFLRQIVLDKNENIHLCARVGLTTLDIDPQPGKLMVGQKQLFTASYSPTGQLLSHHIYGTDHYENGYFKEIVSQGNRIYYVGQSNGGGVYLDESGDSTIVSTRGAFVIGADLNEKPLWVNTYLPNHILSKITGSFDTKQNLFLHTSFEQETDLNPGEDQNIVYPFDKNDFLVFSIDSNGALGFYDTFGGFENQSFSNDLDYKPIAILENDALVFCADFSPAELSLNPQDPLDLVKPNSSLLLDTILDPVLYFNKM